MNHIAALILRIAARAAARLYEQPKFRNVQTEYAYCDMLTAAHEYEAR